MSMDTDRMDEVVAVVSPRSRGGVSLFEAEAITSGTVDGFQSEPSVSSEAARELRRLGFRIAQDDPVTLSISGPRELFQQVFRTELRTVTKVVLHDLEQEFWMHDDPGRPLTAAGRLGELIEGAALPEPPLYYASALPPISTPAPGAYRYLFVPDDVGALLSADKVHVMGGTGAGVRVAMPDTGFFSHPFYAQHMYAVRTVILGPGAANPGHDDFGHGTGEAANIFAVAPNVELQPVKMGSDTVGAINAAVASGARVITNSWGYDIDFPGATLTPYLRSLAAAVAHAVASGVVVCFSAGNGQRSFPGSHPDVISCGGVMVNHPNLDLEASSYASSFDSALFPGRHVPDLCGLVGRRVVDRAPLIMLPVQPGCTLDTALAVPSAAGGPADGTTTGDGWALFSGTSAASPQMAGVVALLLQKQPHLTPAQVKALLVGHATDVTAGHSGLGDAAGPGWDRATGAGLVNAKWSWLVAMSDLAVQFFEATPEAQVEMLSGGEAPFPRVTRQLLSNLMRIRTS